MPVISVMIGECWFGKRLTGNGCDVTSTVTAFAWRSWVKSYNTSRRDSWCSGRDSNWALLGTNKKSYDLSVAWKTRNACVARSLYTLQTAQNEGSRPADAKVRCSLQPVPANAFSVAIVVRRWFRTLSSIRGLSLLFTALRTPHHYNYSQPLFYSA